jgi:hypothetical protein
VLAGVRDVHNPQAAAADTRSKQDAAPSALGAEQLSQVLREHDRELQRCYEEAMIATLMRPGAEKGEEIRPLHLDFELEVNATGEVGDVVIHGNASPQLQTCATRAIRSWKFPNSQGSTQLRFPVIFQPNIVQR